MARFVLTIEAMVEAPRLNGCVGAAEAQRQAMANMLGNPMLKALLESAGVKLVGYRVAEDIKAIK